MADEPQFRRVQTQFIAAAIDPVHGEGMKASSGKGSSDWGIWRADPGPRGVQLREYDRLESTGGVAPRGWKFDKVQALRVKPHRTPCRETKSNTVRTYNAAARERADPRLTLQPCATQSDWWLEEHGLIMEKPSFPLPPGEYPTLSLSLSLFPF